QVFCTGWKGTTSQVYKPKAGRAMRSGFVFRNHLCIYSSTCLYSSLQTHTMQVICLEEQAFYTLLEEVVARLKAQMPAAPSKWIGQQEAMQLLQIKSKTTLQKIRDEGKIRFSQPEKRIILYDRESINAYLEQLAKETF